MSKTHRIIIKRKRGINWMRNPKHKHKLLAGEPSKTVVTNWDDKPIAALEEVKHIAKKLL